jgi:hypothetical protein
MDAHRRRPWNSGLSLVNAVLPKRNMRVNA